MSRLAPLLEIQDLDVAVGAARDRSEKLPEREALPHLEAALAAIDTQLAAASADRVELLAEEERVDREVSQVARDIEAAEVERYSGKHKNRDDASTHEESQRLLREKQSSLEEREMELLESIETVENRIEEYESTRATHLAESEKIREAIRKVETEVSAELERLADARIAIIPRVPQDVYAAYERVRAQPRTGGRAVAMLEKGHCSGCRIKLPSLETARMLALPEEALIQCPQCRRVLVR